MSKKNKLNLKPLIIIPTHTYPHGCGDIWLDDELPYLLSLSADIIFMPTNCGHSQEKKSTPFFSKVLSRSILEKVVSFVSLSSIVFFVKL